MFCLCLLSNFPELLLGNTFKRYLLKSQRSCLKIGPKCILLSASFLGNELALFPRHSGGKEVSKGTVDRFWRGSPLPSPYIKLINKIQAEWNLNEEILCTKRKVIATLGMSAAK